MKSDLQGEVYKRQEQNLLLVKGRFSMRGIELLAAFGHIDEKYVWEAEQPFIKKKHMAYRKWVGIAACLCLAAGLIFFAVRAGREAGLAQDNPSDYIPDIPIAEERKDVSVDGGILRDFDSFDSAESGELQKIDPSGNFSGDMGTGCYTAKEALELQSNPAGASENIAEIKTMPVYERKNQADTYGLVFLSEKDIEEGEAYLAEIAQRLGWEFNGVEVHAGETQVSSLTVECGQGTMELGADGCLYVSGLGFKPEQGQKESNFVTEIMKRLECISGFGETRTYVWESYGYDGKKDKQYYGYEEAGSLKEQIQNCALSKLWCYVEKDGTIDAFRLYHDRKNTSCLGEYPIISRKKAEKLLFQGKYCSQYAESFPNNAKVSACELTYVPELASQVLMPYYSFLVEVPGEKEDEKRGLKTFARFYVPAVQEKYFSDSFQWEFAVD